MAKPYEFCQKHLPAGSDIGLSLTLLHNNPAIWKNPTDFDPDRFLTQQFSNYEYAPFGDGAKGRMGKYFAMYEIKIVLAILLLHCRFVNIPKQTPSKRLYGINVGIKEPIFATVDSIKKGKKGDNLFR